MFIDSDVEMSRPPSGGQCFYSSVKRNTGLQADQHMSVIRHRVYLDQLLALLPNNAGDVFLKLFFEVRPYQTLPQANGKDRLNVDLCERVSHLHLQVSRLVGRPASFGSDERNNQMKDDMALLTEGENISKRGSINIALLTEGELARGLGL